jgi:hypothetical protein
MEFWRRTTGPLFFLGLTESAELPVRAFYALKNVEMAEACHFRRHWDSGEGLESGPF